MPWPMTRAPTQAHEAPVSVAFLDGLELRRMAEPGCRRRSGTPCALDGVRLDDLIWQIAEAKPQVRGVNAWRPACKIAQPHDRDKNSPPGITDWP